MSSYRGIVLARKGSGRYALARTQIQYCKPPHAQTPFLLVCCVCVCWSQIYTPPLAPFSSSPSINHHFLEPITNPSSSKGKTIMSIPSINLTHAFTLKLAIASSLSIPGTPVGDRCKSPFPDPPFLFADQVELCTVERNSLHPSCWWNAHWPRC